MKPDEIEEQVNEIREVGDDASGVRMIAGVPETSERVRLTGYSLPDVVGLGRELNANTFYVSVERDDDGTFQFAQVAFFHEGVAHVCSVETEDYLRRRASERGAQIPRGPGIDSEDEEELERIEELAEQILESFGDFLSDSKRYRLENHPEHYEVHRLLQLQERLEERKRRAEEEERIDEELEDELARRVHEDDRFVRQFNESDTRMLLQDLDLEFDEDAVRIEKVHRKAKSLLKINR